MMTRRHIGAGGILDFDPEFLPTTNADQLMSHLQDDVEWEQKYYTNYRNGEKYPQPRLTAWYADDPKMVYSYSGVTQKVQVWLPALLTVKQSIEKVTGVDYNSVLLNYYRDGKDSVGMHADDEKELGTNANIASVSLGATRIFRLSQYRYNLDPDYIPHPEMESKDAAGCPVGLFEYELSHGSLLVMSGTTQQYWKHEIPKMITTPGQLKKGIKPVGPRINLTFRKFKGYNEKI